MELSKLSKELDGLLAMCNESNKEDKAMKDGLDFLLNEYKTNKHYFRTEPGKVTVEDVIKTCFEFGWASKRNYDSQDL